MAWGRVKDFRDEQDFGKLKGSRFTLLVLVPIIPTVETEIIFMATKQDVSPHRILKKGLAKKIDNFLKIPEKSSKKKRQLINASN